MYIKIKQNQRQLPIDIPGRIITVVFKETIINHGKLQTCIHTRNSQTTIVRIGI